jgi:hypothetical protein
MHRRSWFWLAGVAGVVIGASLQACGGGGSSPASAADSGAGADATGDTGVSAESGPGEASSEASSDSGASEAAGDGFVPAAHGPFPQVPNTHGKTMSSPKLVTIVASNDAPTDGTDTAAGLHAFSDAIPSSAVWQAMSSEYHLGTLTSAVHITGPAMTASVYTTADLQAYVTSAIAGGAGPAPDGNTIYLVYLPDSATFAPVYANFCGYHMPYPSSTTSTGDQVSAVHRCKPYTKDTELGLLTLVASHEIVESATDPLDQGYNIGSASATPWDAGIWQGWYQGHVELGDLCEGTRFYEVADGGPEGGFEYQRMWSNAAAAKGGDPCAPPYDEPYYSVATPMGWYPVTAGGSVTIPVTGWSAGPTGDWLVKAVFSSTNDTAVLGGITDSGVHLTSDAAIESPAGCIARYGLNNGTGAQLQVTAPAAAKSGDFVVLKLYTFRETSGCYPPLTGDDYHFVPVGVYVP